MIIDQSLYCRFCLHFQKDMFINTQSPIQRHETFSIHFSQASSVSTLAIPHLHRFVAFSYKQIRPVWRCLFGLKKKAFDLVDHRIFLSKLSVYLNSSNSLPFFSSYLKNRVQRVFIRGSYSSEGPVKYGVPQGSVLGHVLFCIYINDLRLHIPSNSAEYHNMLADDTTLHTTGRSVVQIQKTLQLCLDRISVWCNVNHMLINPVKTKSMIISTRQKHQLSGLSLRLSLDGQNIENVT